MKRTPEEQDFKYKCRTAGYSVDDRLRADCRSHLCGDIKDGIMLAHDKEAGFVLAFSDLEAIYKLAKKAREKS